MTIQTNVDFNDKLVANSKFLFYRGMQSEWSQILYSLHVIPSPH